MAWEIVKATGGNLETTAQKVAASFDYVFHFVQLANKSQKRLRGIYELNLDRKTGEIRMVRICAYDYQSDSWRWRYHIEKTKSSPLKRRILKLLEGFQGS